MLSSQTATQVSSVTISIVISIVTFIASLAAAMFVSGMKWGMVTRDIKVMSEKIAKIEGMFELRIRRNSDRD